MTGVAITSLRVFCQTESLGFRSNFHSSSPLAALSARSTPPPGPEPYATLLEHRLAVTFDFQPIDFIAPDIEVPVRLSFEDSLRGLETKIPVEVTTACRECGGSGAEPGTSPVICPECHGRGVISESQGLFALSQPCPRCRGNGTVIEKPCKKCKGSGRERRTKRYTVKIPAGVKDGTRIRLKGKGELGEAGGAAGDLYVVTRVEPSKKFERRGADLLIEVPVTYTEAALGATVEVPTPYGERVSLKVPAGTQDGRLLRIRGHGAPKLGGSGKGDLIARLRVSVPKKLSKKEREALEELQNLSHDDPREALFS